jgi:hypothetical protein
MATTKRPARKSASRAPAKATRPKATPAKAAAASARKRPSVPGKPTPAARRATAQTGGKSTNGRAANGSGTDGAARSLERDWEMLLDRKRPVARRTAALMALGWAILSDKARFRSVLAILRNVDEPIDLRLEVLSAVQSATFDANRFAAFRPDYIKALRALSADPDMELRQRVLGFLARENDAPTQEALLQGLRHPDEALLPPEKALQLLSYDVHNEAYAAAREIADRPPNALARREALRLLAADGKSAPLFEKLVLDKGESSEVRQLAASALHKLAPQRMQDCARRMTLDDDEDDDMQTVSLTALANFGSEATRQDPQLREQVRKLSEVKAKRPGVESAALRFLERRPPGTQQP